MPLKIRIFTILLSLFWLNVSFATSHSNRINFLTMSDIHLDIYSHGMNINPRGLHSENDLDEETFITMLFDLRKKIQKGIIPQPKFILVQGDIVGHSRRKDSVLQEETRVFQLLKKNFPHTTLFYLFGNNDSFAINYGNFNQGNSPYQIAKENGWQGGFISTSSMCNEKKIFPCLIQNTIDTKDGYYSAFLQPHLKLVALNTILFSKRSQNTQDDAIRKELTWLNQQLNSAKQNHDFVLIAMHIPPGKNVYDDSAFWHKEIKASFLQLISQYKNIVIGLLAAHTHMEELKVIKDIDDHVITEVWFTPALSTSHGNAPAVKSFELLEKNHLWRLSDYSVYYYAKNIGFQFLYNYNQFYCEKKSDDMRSCIQNISAKKMEDYFAAGNKNYMGKIYFPNNIFIKP